MKNSHEEENSLDRFMNEFGRVLNSEKRVKEEEEEKNNIK
jgi:hypothetical protein